MTEIVQGWTEPITAQLLADGEPVDLTGCTVVFVLYDKAGVAVSLSGTASIVTAASGDVKFSPAVGDLLAASTPHKARWKVTDGSGKISYFPNGEAEVMIVRLP